MKVPSHARHTAPDSTGWWYLHTILRSQPFLVFLDETKLASIQKGWAHTSSCWKLEDSIDTPVARILTAAMEKPQLMWDLAMAVSSLQVAGPWHELPQRKDTRYFARVAPDGSRVVLVRSHGATWAYHGAHIEQGTEATLEAAMTEADQKLKDRGYLLGSY